MSLQLVRIALFLPFLSTVSTRNDQKTGPPSFSVIQTPSFLNVMEGSDIVLNCMMEGNVTSQWYLKWMKIGKEKEIKNSSQIFVIKNEMNKSSTLILKAADIADSGTYQCCIGVLSDVRNNVTEVIIWEAPNVLVSQTPRHVNKTEGANIAIKCHFRRAANLSLIEVKWHKDNQELSSLNHSVQFSQEGTLTLMNANVEDSGNYVCTVRIRNRTGSGDGTHVRITAANLLVIQSPVFILATEGANLTLDCRVQGKEAKRLLGVTWYKTASDGQKSLLSSATTVLKGRASLWLKDVKKEDSGNYTCEVDRYGQGNGTRVTILAGRKRPLQNATIDADHRQPGQTEENMGSGVGIPMGVGVAAGTLIFLLLMGIMVWRSKRKGKGTSGNASEVGPALTQGARKQPNCSTSPNISSLHQPQTSRIVGTTAPITPRLLGVVALAHLEGETFLQHASLTNQASNVTYADLRFHKREVQADAEVVYAEVRMGAKQPGCKERATQPAGLC